jgi:hypothetical protein
VTSPETNAFGLGSLFELSSVEREHDREDPRDEKAFLHLYGLQHWLRDRLGRHLGRGLVSGRHRYPARVRFGFRRVGDRVAVGDDRQSRLPTAETAHRAVIRVSEGKWDGQGRGGENVDVELVVGVAQPSINVGALAANVDAHISLI